MLRRKTSDAAAYDWFWFALDRLRLADLGWKHQGLTAAGIELLQEAVERLLKGVLVGSGRKLKRTHDLRVLLREAVEIDARFGGFSDLARELTEGFFEVHYPGGDLTDVGENYADLRRQAGELMAIVQELFPKDFPTGTA